MSQQRRRSIVSGSMVVLAGIMAGCEAETPPPAPVIRPVRYIEVTAATGGQPRMFSGVARAGVETGLSFRVAGTVEQVPVKVGDRVRAGQLIAQIDPIDYELQVRQAEAALRQAEAQASNAEADLRRVQGLYENDNASRDDLDAALAGAASADAQVESFSKQLDLVRRQVAYTGLRAAVAGAIAEIRVEANENVAAGQVVAVLTSDVEPEVELAVPESLITQIAEGDTVSVRFDALAGRTFEGVVTEVGVSATDLATTFPVSVRLREADREVRPGMAAEVTFLFGADDTTEHFFVPPEAVGEDREGRFVFVARPSDGGLGVARRRAVTVGDFTPTGIEIREGLVGGDLVVTAGVNRIEDGQEVRLTRAGGD